MKIVKDDSAGVEVLTVTGKLDSTNASEFDARLREDVDESSGRAVILEFAGVQTLTSAPLRAILSLAKRMQRHGAMLIVAAPAENALESLRISGFLKLKIFELTETLEAALALAHQSARQPARLRTGASPSGPLPGVQPLPPSHLPPTLADLPTKPQPGPAGLTSATTAPTSPAKAATSLTSTQTTIPATQLGALPAVAPAPQPTAAAAFAPASAPLLKPVPTDSPPTKPSAATPPPGLPPASKATHAPEAAKPAEAAQASRAAKAPEVKPAPKIVNPFALPQQPARPAEAKPASTPAPDSKPPALPDLTSASTPDLKAEPPPVAKPQAIPLPAAKAEPHPAPKPKPPPAAQPQPASTTVAPPSGSRPPPPPATSVHPPPVPSRREPGLIGWFNYWACEVQDALDYWLGMFRRK